MTVYVYPDGHINIADLRSEQQNYVAANKEEAMAAFDRMIELAQEELAAKADPR